MPIDKTDVAKKPGTTPDGGNQPIAETILHGQTQRDPNEAALAEQAIRHFLRDRLQNWYEQMERAIDGLEAWLAAQPAEEQQLFSSRGYFDELGDQFMRELFTLAGGKGTPVMDALAGEVYNTIAFAQRSCFDYRIFVNEMRRGVRDACWFMRDACQHVLSNQWADLLDLATSGSVEFVPALFQMGLPSDAFKPKELTERLTKHSDAYRKSYGPKKDAAAEKANEKGVNDQKKVEAEDEAKKLSEQELEPVKKETQAMA